MIKTKDQDSTILSKNTFPVVGIGASAGGLDAFQKLVKSISPESGIAFIIVQHLSPGHESSLPQILKKDCKIPVVEISDNLEVKPDHVYVIPSNKLLTVNDGILELSPRPADNKLLNSIDIFFSSLAEVHRNHSIAVILSGSGKDGTAGLTAIKSHGGFSIAQDPASAAYKNMPQNAIDNGVIDYILQPEKIPGELQKLIKAHNSSEQTLKSTDKQESETFTQIMSLLKQKIGVDFSLYKKPTISRRILRRIGMNQVSNMREYLDLLQKNPAEQAILFDDLLIPVTSFFRDTAAFENFCNTVLEKIFAGKSLDNPLRIWVAGCSTGQEAYSIAICLHEYLEKNKLKVKIQIFATDLSEKAIKKARSGVYLKDQMTGISKERLQKYFIDHDTTFQTIKTIRDMCIFARHNFLNDPPFVKVDLITCRNVLIYLEPYLQKKALSTFQYALNGQNETAGKQGILWLGKSETTGSAADLFTPLGKKEKFYTRKTVSAKFSITANNRNQAGLYTPEPLYGMVTRKPRTFKKTRMISYYPGILLLESLWILIMILSRFGESPEIFSNRHPAKPASIF